jgi:hypothetical protein
MERQEDGDAYAAFVLNALETGEPITFQGRTVRKDVPRLIARKKQRDIDRWERDRQEAIAEADLAVDYANNLARLLGGQPNSVSLTKEKASNWEAFANIDGWRIRATGHTPLQAVKVLIRRLEKCHLKDLSSVQYAKRRV